MMTTERVSPGMPYGLVLLFAIAGGAAVGNLYWAQPLLAQIASALGVPVGAAGGLVTATQLGYALGVLLIVPLGDSLNRRRLIPALMGASAVALFVTALAPTYEVLLCSLVAVGVTTVSAQLLVPLAGDLASGDQRGHVIGFIASGVMIGILLSRTVSGILAAWLGWRAVYFLASAVILIMATVLFRCLPADKSRPRLPYGALLRSIPQNVRGSSAIQVTLVLGACVFAVFTLFWTGLTFLLSSPAFNWSVTQIGFVGLVGLAGALAARRAGRLHDRGWSSPATGGAIVLALLSIGLAALGASSVGLTLLAVLLIDIAVQGINVLNQTRLISIRPAARSRLNTAFVACNFMGGAVGSMLAGLLWNQGGWLLICAVEAGLLLFSLVIWSCKRKSLEIPKQINS